MALWGSPFVKATWARLICGALGGEKKASYYRMSQEIKDLDILTQILLEYAKSRNFELYGPVEIEYGFGWDPSLSFWHNNRRMHLYFEFVRFARNEDGLTVELAEINSPWKTRRAIVKTIDEILSLVDTFFIQGCAEEELPKFDWIFDNRDQDKFIPHPPDKSNPANITEVVSNMQLWQRPKEPDE